MSSRCKLIVDEVYDLAKVVDDSSRPQDVSFFSDKVREAEVLLARALQEHPDDSDFLEVEARFRQALSQDDKAVRALEKAWLSGPRHSGVAIRLARLYGANGQLNLALDILGKALEKNPDDKPANFEVALVMLHGQTINTKQVLAHLSRSYGMGDSNIDARHLHAQLLFLAGDAAAASKLFDEVNQTAPREYRTATPQRLSPVAARLSSYQGRVAKKVRHLRFHTLLCLRGGHLCA